MHLMTSPPSEPPAGHQHCTPHHPLSSPAQVLACLAIPLLSLPTLSSSVLPSLCLAIDSFATGAVLGCCHNTPLCGDMRCGCLGAFGQGAAPEMPLVLGGQCLCSCRSAFSLGNRAVPRSLSFQQLPPSAEALGTLQLWGQGPPAHHITPAQAPSAACGTQGREDPQRRSGTFIAKAQAQGMESWVRLHSQLFPRQAAPEPCSLAPASLLSFAHRSSVCIS